MNEILAFLALFNCVPTDNIVIDDSLDRPGYYYHQSHAVHIKSNASKSVLVHELYHSCQLKPTNQAESDLNEREAHYVERVWFYNHRGD